MRVLRSRLYDLELEKQQKAVADERRMMVGSGDRSEKIRTYNYPQDRVTDHRSNANFHDIPRLMDGGLEDLFDRLSAWEEERLLAEATA